MVMPKQSGARNGLRDRCPVEVVRRAEGGRIAASTSTTLTPGASSARDPTETGSSGWSRWAYISVTTGLSRPASSTTTRALNSQAWRTTRCEVPTKLVVPRAFTECAPGA